MTRQDNRTPEFERRPRIGVGTSASRSYRRTHGCTHDTCRNRTLAAAMAALLSALPIDLVAESTVSYFVFRMVEGVFQPSAQVIRVVRGDEVDLHRHSDEKLEIHLHGYELLRGVEPGQRATIAIEAEVSGRFPITRHGGGETQARSHEVLPYIGVYPE